MKESTFDMPADNSKDMHRQQQRMKWYNILSLYLKLIAFEGIEN
jgi:hypothetical protein